MFNEGLPSSFSCTAPSIETANGVLHPLIKIQDTTECTFPPYTVDLDLDDTQRTFRIRPTGGLLVATPEYIPAYAGGLVPKDTLTTKSSYSALSVIMNNGRSRHGSRKFELFGEEGKPNKYTQLFMSEVAADQFVGAIALAMNKQVSRRKKSLENK
jgi:hypothetical protein